MASIRHNFSRNQIKANVKPHLQQSYQSSVASSTINLNGAPPPPPALQTVRTQTLKNGSPIVSIQMLKTKICADFQNNRCTRGVNCPYAHGETEIRQLPDLRKTKMCMLYNVGKCNSSTCKFAHSPQELRFTCQFPQFKTGLCRFHLAEGGRGCKYGDKCPYAHGQYELRIPNNAQPMQDKGIHTNIDMIEDETMNYTFENSRNFDTPFEENVNENGAADINIPHFYDTPTTTGCDEKRDLENMKIDDALESTINILNILSKKDTPEHETSPSNTILNNSISTSYVRYKHINNGDISVSTTPSILESINSEELESLEGSIDNNPIHLPSRLKNTKSRVYTVSSSKDSSSKKSSRVSSILYPDVASVPVPPSPTSSFLTNLKFENDINIFPKETEDPININNRKEIYNLIKTPILIVNQNNHNIIHQPDNLNKANHEHQHYANQKQHYTHQRQPYYPQNQYFSHSRKQYNSNPSHLTYNKQQIHPSIDKYNSHDDIPSNYKFVYSNPKNMYIPLEPKNSQDQIYHRKVIGDDLLTKPNHNSFPAMINHDLHHTDQISMKYPQDDISADNRNNPVYSYLPYKDFRYNISKHIENTSQYNVENDNLFDRIHDKTLGPPPGFEAIFRQNFENSYSKSHFLADRTYRASSTQSKESKPLLCSIFHTHNNNTPTQYKK